MGMCYECGKGVAINMATAAKWYRLGAEQGDTFSQCDLAALYKAGEGVTKDWSEAAAWYDKAVDQGDCGAEFSVASMYLSGGHGLEQDTRAARNLLIRSANKQHAPAILALREFRRCHACGAHNARHTCKICTTARYCTKECQRRH